MKTFESNDAEYLEWLANHQSGFVVNSRRKPTASYLVLHRATCPSIDGRIRGVPGGYTERAYIKFTSDSIEDLRGSLAAISPRFSTVCSRCDPHSTKQA